MIKKKPFYSINLFELGFFRDRWYKPTHSTRIQITSPLETSSAPVTSARDQKVSLIERLCSDFDIKSQSNQFFFITSYNLKIYNFNLYSFLFTGTRTENLSISITEYVVRYKIEVKIFVDCSNVTNERSWIKILLVNAGLFSNIIKQYQRTS